MELTGDPVLDYIEEAVMFLENHDLHWRVPPNFAKYPLEDQRIWLWNTNKVLSLRISRAFGAPLMPANVKDFMEGGPRPPITG